jgi:hypothetical protein
MIIEQSSPSDKLIPRLWRPMRAWLKALRLAVRRLNCVSVPTPAREGLCRRAAARRMKEFLARRYRQPNRCC